MNPLIILACVGTFTPVEISPASINETLTMSIDFSKNLVTGGIGSPYQIRESTDLKITFWTRYQRPDGVETTVEGKIDRVNGQTSIIGRIGSGR